MSSTASPAITLRLLKLYPDGTAEPYGPAAHDALHLTAAYSHFDLGDDSWQANVPVDMQYAANLVVSCQATGRECLDGLLNPPFRLSIAGIEHEITTHKHANGLKMDLVPVHYPSSKLKGKSCYAPHYIQANFSLLDGETVVFPLIQQSEYTGHLLPNMHDRDVVRHLIHRKQLSNPSFSSGAF